jgi:hypothetical protein
LKSAITKPFDLLGLVSSGERGSWPRFFCGKAYVLTQLPAFAIKASRLCRSGFIPHGYNLRIMK